MASEKVRLPDVDGLFGSLSQSVAGKVLECGRCKRLAGMTSEQAGSYFRKGWPRCCGQTMTLVSA